jgi:hypothetical protein
MSVELKDVTVQDAEPEPLVVPLLYTNGDLLIDVPDTVDAEQIPNISRVRISRDGQPFDVLLDIPVRLQPYDKPHYDLRGLGWPPWLQHLWLTAGGSLAGITEPTVSQVLYAIAVANKPTRQLPHAPYLIVETGVRFGATACWLALAAQAAGGIYQGFEMLPGFVDFVNGVFENHGLHRCSRVICGKAPEAVTERFGEASIDLLFCDDDHRGEHVKQEIQAFWPLIRPGGILAFHDVLGGFSIWDLIKPLGGIKLVHQPFNQLGQAPFGGLGIVRKPAE